MIDISNLTVEGCISLGLKNGSRFCLNNIFFGSVKNVKTDQKDVISISYDSQPNLILAMALPLIWSTAILFENAEEEMLFCLGMKL